MSARIPHWKCKIIRQTSLVIGTSTVTKIFSFPQKIVNIKGATHFHLFIHAWGKNYYDTVKQSLWVHDIITSMLSLVAIIQRRMDDQWLYNGAQESSNVPHHFYLGNSWILIFLILWLPCIKSWTNPSWLLFHVRTKNVIRFLFLCNTFMQSTHFLMLCWFTETDIVVTEPWRKRSRASIRIFYKDRE